MVAVSARLTLHVDTLNEETLACNDKLLAVWAVGIFPIMAPDISTIHEMQPFTQSDFLCPLNGRYWCGWCTIVFVAGIIPAYVPGD
jgi:hypothetical protein